MIKTNIRRGWALLALAAIAAPLAPARADIAKNIILMISDGQGFNTIQATDYYNGSKAVYEDAEYVRFGMNTNSAGSRGGYTGAAYNPASMAASFNYSTTGATDSASAATAMFTGVKNYDNEVNYTTDSKVLTTFFEKFAGFGKSIGAVSTVEVSHATPAAVYGHNKARGNYSAIISEAIYGSNPVNDLGNSGVNKLAGDNNNYNANNYNGYLKVIMGAGHPYYDNNGVYNAAGNNNGQYVGGRDGVTNKGWNDLGTGVNGWTLVDTTTGIQNLATGATPDKVFAVAPVYETLQSSRLPSHPTNDKTAPYGDAQTANMPTLVDMTKAALNVLDNNSYGFGVMIEGGAIDWANHSDLAGRMIEEQRDFNAAVEAVEAYLDANTNGNNWNNTLLIVTADHETGHLWGDPTNVGTFFDVNGDSTFTAGIDYPHVKNLGANSLPGVNFNSTNHTNALVPLFARGAGSELFASHILGTDLNLASIYNLDGTWNGQYIDNTSVYTVMQDAAAIPEPGTIGLVALAFAGIAALRRRRA